VRATHNKEPISEAASGHAVMHVHFLCCVSARVVACARRRARCVEKTVRALFDGTSKEASAE
jgi:hypothetical protein